MARRNVVFIPNGYYHLYNRGAHQSDIFRSDADYVFLLKKLKELAARDNISVIAYCLMSNHYHFLMRQNGEIEISSLMQALFNNYSKAFNIKYRHSGTLFEGPYKAIAVETGSYLLHVCRYIHRNPLEAGMVVKPEQWHYSNYPEFIGARNGSLVDHEFVTENFGTPAEYQAFVMDYIPPEKTQQELRHYLFFD
jgi:REP element-mobilizing transposase RayT